jgi:hypothetical protein
VTDDIARLQLEINAESVKAGTAALKEFTEQGKVAEATAARLRGALSTATTTTTANTGTEVARVAEERTRRKVKADQDEVASENTKNAAYQLALYRYQLGIIRATEIAEATALRRIAAENRVVAAYEQAMRRYERVLLRAQELAMTEDQRRAAAAERKLRAQQEEIAKSIVLEMDRQRKMRALYDQAYEEDKARRRRADAEIKRAETQNKSQERLAASQARSNDVYYQAGVRDPKLLAADIAAVSRARAQAREDLRTEAIGVKEYDRTLDLLNKRMNLLVEGNSRHRGAIRQTAAAMASLAFEATGAIYLVTALAGVLAAPAIFGTKLLATLETTRLGMAGILTAMGRINGQTLELPKALDISGQMMNKLVADSLRFGVSIDSLAQTLRATIAPGLASGMNLKQIQEVATIGTLAVKTIGLESRQAVQEIRDLVAGGITAASSTLATSLSIKDSDIKRWREAGTVYDELMKRMKGFEEAGAESTKTLVGAWDQFKTKMALLLSDEEGFTGIKKALIDLSNYVGVFNEATGKMEFNPDLLRTIDTYWSLLKSVAESIKPIGVAFTDLLPIVQPILSSFALGLAVLVNGTKFWIDTLVTGAKQLTALSVLDFSTVMAEGDAWAERGKKRMQELYDTKERLFPSDKPVVPPPAQTDTSGVTGSAAALINAARERWKKYTDITVEGLTREHELVQAALAKDAENIKKAKLEQPREDTEEYRKKGHQAYLTDLKAFNDNILQAETELRLAREGENQKYQEALERLLKKDARLEGMHAYMVGLSTLAAQSGKALTEFEKLRQELAQHPEKYRKITEGERLAMEWLAKYTDEVKASRDYQNEVIGINDRENKNLDTYIERLKTRLVKTSELKSVEEAQLALRQRLLAVSLEEQAARIRAANTGADTVSAANLERARALEAQAKKHREAAGLHNQIGDVEAGYEARDALIDASKSVADAWAEAAASIRESLGDAFGDTGASLGALIASYADGNARIEEINTKRLQALKDNVEDEQTVELRALRERKSAEYNTYAEMSGAAKGFFDEKSKGYQVLLAAERAFRIMQLVMSASAIAVSKAETTATLADSGTRATAYTAEGVAHGFAQTGVGGFAVAAGIIAFMASLGVKSKGGSGGGRFSAESVQTSQGTGTVLGDSDAKSESIANSLSIMSGNSDVMIDYTRDMARSLQKIEQSIDRVAAGIARQLGVNGGIFDSGSLPLGESGRWVDSAGASVFEKIGDTIGNAVFGGKKKTTLRDQGIRFADQTVAEASAFIDAFAYQVTKTVRDGGLLHRDRTSYKTYETELDNEIQRWLTLTVKELRDTVVEAAEAIGVSGAGARIDATKLGLDKLSLKDLTGEEIAQAVTDVMSAAFDTMAEVVTPVLLDLQRAGEGLGETLLRVANDYIGVDAALSSIGLEFGAVGAASLKARERLVTMAGGVDNLQRSASEFARNFLTPRQLTTILQNQVTAALTAVGYANVRTNEQFYDLVSSLDLTTEIGAETYLKLMDVSGAFAELNKQLKAIEDKRTDLEIELLRVSGQELAAVTKERERELSSLDESLRPLQMQIYAQEDLNRAYETASGRMKELKLLTTDSFKTMLDYTKYLHRANRAGVPGAEAALPATPSNTFIPGKTNTPADNQFLAAIDKLREQLVSGQIAQAVYMQQSAAVLKRWEAAGMPETREVA